MSNKGKTIYNTQWIHQLKECITEEIPEGWTDKVPIYDKPCIWEIDKWIVDVEKYRQVVMRNINESFSSELQTGKFYSVALNADVDCRRGGHNNDKQNVEGLLAHMIRTGTPTIHYVAHGRIVPDVTQEQLKNLITEMEEYVLSLYHKRWILRDQINNAKDTDELSAIKWIEEVEERKI